MLDTMIVPYPCHIVKIMGRGDIIKAKSCISSLRKRCNLRLMIYACGALPLRAAKKRQGRLPLPKDQLSDQRSLMASTGFFFAMRLTGKKEARIATPTLMTSIKTNCLGP